MPLPGIKKCSRGGAFQNETGLTLVEMLASISITAVLLGVLAQFLFSCAGLWAKSDRSYQKQHLMKFIYQNVYRDLTAIYPGSYLPEDAVKGNQNQLVFWEESNRGLVQVKYRFDQSTGKLYRSSGFWGSQPEEAPLVIDIVDWKFEYYESATKNWLFEWESKQRNNIPALIRITVKSKIGDLGAFTFPVKAWHPEGNPNDKG